MKDVTKKKISTALKKYHKCAKRHKCGAKKKRGKTPKPHKKKRGETLKKKKKGKGLPGGFNIHTGKLDELFHDET